MSTSPASKLFRFDFDRVASHAELVLFFLLVTLLARSIAAQTLYGSLIGNVTDPSGATVPSATVEATNTALGLKKATQTNEIGRAHV